MDVTERGMERPIFPLGDVAIAYETSASEAREQGKTLSEHLSHLVVHGVLHLLGYDHLTKAQANDMETLETAVLARFGHSDPYRARPVRQNSRGPRKQPPADRPRT
jgi:probable rRNA maturation factor